MHEVKILIHDDKKHFYKYIRSKLAESFAKKIYDIDYVRDTTVISVEYDIYIINICSESAADLVKKIRIDDEDAFILFCSDSANVLYDFKDLTDGEFKNNKDSILMLSGLIKTCFAENQKLQHINSQLHVLQDNVSHFVELMSREKHPTFFSAHNK